MGQFDESEVILRALNDGPLFVIAIVFIACTAGIIISLIATMRSVNVARQREQTKREVAAYVAEGSISPADAVAIIEAGKAFDLNDAVKKANFASWAGKCPQNPHASPA